MEHSSAFKRTDRAIMIAFIQLLKVKPFEKITIKDILEATPVTRATFYAHYKDKYEIAEKMLEYFLELRKDVRLELCEHEDVDMPSFVKKSYINNKEIVQSLEKIHTETVNLRQSIIQDFINEYSTDSHAYTPVESKIYAQARTELEIALLTQEIEPITFDQENSILLNVSLKLLRLNDDPEVEHFLKKKLLEKKEKITKKKK